MRESIKKRIEAVRHGEVPEGYKRTDSGVIPEEWPNSTIGKIIAFHSEKSTINNEYPVLTSARSGLVLQTEYFEDQVTREENAGYNVIPYGYVTYRSRSDDGRFTFNQNQIIEKGIVSCFYPVFRIIEDLADPTFVLSYLNNYLGRQIVKEIVGTSQLVLSEKKLSELRLPCPPLAEQQKIAKILATCDRVIELKQCKIDELNKLKQTYLRKMFPQKGKTVPEIRFPDFSDPWEQRKAIDIADYSKGNGYSKGDLTDTGTPIILYGRLYTKYQFAISEVDTFAVPRNGAVYSQGNEVIVPASGETAEDIARASAVEKSGVLLGGDLNILRPFDFINPLFLALAISNGEPQKELAKKAQGKSVVHIHNTDIQEVTIAYPSRTEQDRIVSVFRQLDNLITLHQRELEEYGKYKKALMQLLLTGLVRVNA